jgi:NAD(P)-dependent dehydrogenase (short-subunit alcohol dehydrogenase family)
MDDRRLKVLVTGGGRGLGRAIAVRLSRQGAAVGVLARTAREVEETVESIREEGGNALACPADVLDAARLKGAVERFQEWAGGLDALVCAAGSLHGLGPIAAVDPEIWWRDLETSVRGARNAIRESIASLRRSQHATISLLVGPGHNGPLPFATGYGVAQAALVRLAESLAQELSADGIAVYAVNPGLVPTDLTRPLIQSAEGRRWLPRFQEAFAEGKEVDAEVVAETVQWLIERRPEPLNGRVVAAPATPTILETRLDRIREENRDVLRLR